MELAAVIEERLVAINTLIEMKKKGIASLERHIANIEQFYATDMPCAHKAVLARVLKLSDPWSQQPITQEELTADTERMIAMDRQDLQNLELKIAALHSLSRVKCSAVSELLRGYLRQL